MQTPKNHVTQSHIIHAPQLWMFCIHSSLVMAPLLWQNMQRELLRVEAAASRAGEGPFMTTLPAAYQKCILSHPHTTFRAGKGPFMTTLPLLCKNANCNTLARPHPLNH
uniref:Uncharacterized protein n=1 Tax=Dunaliella tertiolecta TaxID=3047 RepID=A0A7S3QYH5_DUNTE